MNNNISKFLDFFKNPETSLKSIIELVKGTAQKVKQYLYLICILTLLTACAALSGRESAGEYVDDAGITASVKNQILQDPKLKVYQIHVETFKNQVQLSGFVDSSSEVFRAGQIAKNVQGVQDVKNDLVVRKKGLKPGKQR